MKNEDLGFELLLFRRINVEAVLFFLSDQKCFR